MKDSQPTLEGAKTVTAPWYVAMVAMNAASKAQGRMYGPCSAEEDGSRVSAFVESSDIQKIRVVWEKGIDAYASWKSEVTKLESKHAQALRNANYQADHNRRTQAVVRRPDGSTITADPETKKQTETYAAETAKKADLLLKELEALRKAEPKRETIDFYIALNPEVNIACLARV